MKNIYNLLKISFLGLFLTGQLLNAQYDNGVLVANEGNFGSPNADVSYIDRDNLQITNNIYQAVNNEPLGDVLQNIGLYEDKAFLVLNNSNKIVVVDRETFQKLHVITEQVALPRYIAFANDKIYVSNSATGSVSVYDINDYSLVQVIDGLGTVEYVETAGDYVFVQNGAFSSGNSFTVIDSATDSVVSVIEVEDNINGIEATEDYLYVISSSSTKTNIYQYVASTMDLQATITTTNITNGKRLYFSDGKLYFQGNATKIYAIADDLMSEPTQVVSVPDNSWSTLYGFGVVENFILTGDANGFTAASIILIYNKNNGALVAEYSAGIGANGFYDNFYNNMGLEEFVNNLNNITIYPNPAVGTFNIKGVEAAKVMIYNTVGQLVLTTDYNGDAIDVQKLPKGVYFVTIETSFAKVNKKVILK